MIPAAPPILDMLFLDDDGDAAPPEERLEADGDKVADIVFLSLEEDVIFLVVTDGLLIVYICLGNTLVGRNSKGCFLQDL